MHDRQIGQLLDISIHKENILPILAPPKKKL